MPSAVIIGELEGAKKSIGDVEATRVDDGVRGVDWHLGRWGCEPDDGQDRSWKHRTEATGTVWVRDDRELRH